MSRLFAFHPVVVKRRDLTCFVSLDEGNTWPFKRLIHAAGGYSSAIVMDNYDIGLSHNHGHRGEGGIDFVRFNLSWLMDGKESVSAPNRLIPRVQTREATPRTIWREDFDLPDGTTRDSGASAWMALAASGNPDGFSVSKGKFRALDTGGETVWRSEEINIAGMQSISIAVDAIKIGRMDKESDYLRVYYRLGNADEVLIESLRFSLDPQEDFETYQVREQGVDASGHQQVQIVIRGRINGSDEVLYWDRVRVSTP
jgi:hypothetical protein